jgi:type 2 lantibiotic biosynthesis protein LanM
LSPEAILFPLSGGVFANCSSEGDFGAPEVASLVDRAERALALAAGSAWELIAQAAQKELRRASSQYLARILLLRPNADSLQRDIAAWVDAQAEMLARMCLDSEAIGRWSSHRAHAQLTGIETGLSDPHNGIKSTAILTFDSGLRVVYKPRRMEIERWYSELLGWLNNVGAPLRFRNTGVLARDGYGWMEFVPHAPCTSREALCEYYRKAGALLCILHLLRATDCHFQNLIACGRDPVLVDAETLFQPELTESGPMLIARTGLIPSFRFGPEGQTYDVSGLGFVDPKTTHFQVPVWRAEGVSLGPGTLAPGGNVPFASGERSRPQDYVEEMIGGFRQTYRFLAGRRQDLSTRIEKASAFQIRYLVRETVDYYAAYMTSAQGGFAPAPELSIALPDLSVARAVLAPLRPVELAALRRFDVPRFTMAAGGRSIEGIEDCFHRSGTELSLFCIERLCEEDLETQLQHIRLSWGLSRLARSLT